MPSNPNPTRISAPLWNFWVEFKKIEKSAQYGGTYAPKPGYHNFASNLSSRDYSVGGEVAADKQGSRAKSSAIDLTMSATAMVKFTKRLDAACRRRDERLFINGVPIIREFIGTKDNKTVYCYVLVGGRHQGLSTDAGVDYGRDKSHLWHIHISIIRMFCENAAAFERLISILKNESLAAWKARHGIKPPPAKPVAPKPVAPKPATPPKPKPAAPAGLPSFKNGSRVLEYVKGKEMKGTDVKFVQVFIGPKWMGKADGITGPTFVAGVKKYQSMRGLKADGEVGPKTWAAMGVR